MTFSWGAKKSQRHIDRWANRHGTTHLILIEGGGGIGKTFLMRKISKLQVAARFVVDYYDLAEQPAGKVREAQHLVESIGPEHFPGFLTQMNDLGNGKLEVADPRLSEFEREAFATGLRELEAVVRQKRLTQSRTT